MRQWRVYRYGEPWMCGGLERVWRAMQKEMAPYWAAGIGANPESPARAEQGVEVRIASKWSPLSVLSWSSRRLTRKKARFAAGHLTWSGAF